MHIDGNHKLIRWGFVIHGSIDGFSRKIMYLRSYANKASSVLNVFQNSIHKFGFPSRVGADQGVENVEVARFMLTHPLRGPDRKSFIAGKSCHNQRIERLWRDVFCYSLSKFYCAFCYLEDIGLLDITNEVHIFVLRLVFLPRINADLGLFCSAWDNHPIRTANNGTHNQLFIIGQLSYDPNSNIPEIVTDSYGIDFEGPASSEISENRIDTVPVDDILDETDLQQVLQEIDFVAPSDSFGIDIYIRTLKLVENILCTEEQ